MANGEWRMGRIHRGAQAWVQCCAGAGHTDCAPAFVRATGRLQLAAERCQEVQSADSSRLLYRIVVL